MKTLPKYLTNEFLKLLGLCLIIFVSLYLIIDFVLRLDSFIEARAETSIMLDYFIFKIPLVIYQMLPVATLISVIIMFSLLKKRNELTAMKVSGLNIFRVTQPIFGCAILLGIMLFFLNEIVVSYTTSRSNQIWNTEVDRRDPTQLQGINEKWYKGSKGIYWMRRFDFINQTMERPTFFFVDDSFTLIKRIDGQKAVWKQGKWTVEKGIIQEISPEGGYRTAKFETLLLPLQETPETFLKSFGEEDRDPEDMSYWQLKQHAQRVIAEGYDNTEYVVYMNIKIAFPFIVLIMVLMGISISFRVDKAGIPLAISAGVGLCFLYMLALGFTRSLGISGILPPILSAWLTNLIFLFFGLYLMMRVER
jgi:lipopolysaccharide export system permease protein